MTEGETSGDGQKQDTFKPMDLGERHEMIGEINALLDKPENQGIMDAIEGIFDREETGKLAEQLRKAAQEQPENASFVNDLLQMANQSSSVKDKLRFGLLAVLTATTVGVKIESSDGGGGGNGGHH